MNWGKERKVRAVGGVCVGETEERRKTGESGWHGPQAGRLGGCDRREISECVTSEGLQVTSASSLSYDLEGIVPLGSELT